MAYIQQRVEQETIISFDRAGKEANLYTTDPVWLRKMDKLAEEYPETFKVRRQEKYQEKVIATDYTFPHRLISIRSKVRTVNMTEEQKDAARQRLEAARSQ